MNILNIVEYNLNETELIQLCNNRKAVLDSLNYEKNLIDKRLDDATRTFEEAKRTYESEKLRYRNGLNQIHSKQMDVDLLYNRTIERRRLLKSFDPRIICKAVDIALNESHSEIQKKLKPVGTPEYNIAYNLINNMYGVWGSDELTEWYTKLSKEMGSSMYEIEDVHALHYVV